MSEDCEIKDQLEQLDADGAPLEVANLTFIEGILGQGAFGTVRLAKRKVDEEHADCGRKESPSIEPLLPLPAIITPRMRPTRNRPRKYPISRSASAPAGHDFFDISEEEKRASEASSRREVKRSQSHEFHHVNGHDLKDNEQLVAVKIFEKSILKRMRTMERNTETKRVLVKTALEKVEREIALMKKLCHPNLVRQLFCPFPCASLNCHPRLTYLLPTTRSCSSMRLIRPSLICCIWQSNTCHSVVSLRVNGESETSERVI
jgi:serine/threonine protein kinase